MLWSKFKTPTTRLCFIVFWRNLSEKFKVKTQIGCSQSLTLVWIPKSRELISDSQAVQKILSESHESVLICASFMCGIIRDKEDSMLGDLRFVDDGTLIGLREERLNRFLIFDVVSLGSDTTPVLWKYFLPSTPDGHCHARWGDVVGWLRWVFRVIGLIEDS